MRPANAPGAAFSPQRESAAELSERSTEVRRLLASAREALTAGKPLDAIGPLRAARAVPGFSLDRDVLGIAVARLLGVCDLTLDRSVVWLYPGAKEPPPMERPSTA